jgi:transcription antitermination protein NusB
MGLNKPAPKPPARPPERSARRRSRELALQGLYGWLLGQGEAGEVDAHVREQEGFERCDAELYTKLLHGCIVEASALDQALTRHVDRKTSALSPVEHAALMIGAYELLHSPEVPYRVVINEAVELAKRFGGTDGHKYVNGVLDRVSTDLRPIELRERAGKQGNGATA